MKHLLFFILLSLSSALTLTAVENDLMLSTGGPDDETTEDIIKKRTQDRGTNENIEHLHNVWGKTTFLNISLNNTKLSSKEIPSPIGPVAEEFKRDFGVGLQMGKTFNFHKQPLGSVVYIGLDYSWMDINFNSYKESDPPAGYDPDESEWFEYMPWQNKKMTLDYGMSLGPSLTLYPFTSLGNPGTDKIRLHLFFHVGYDIGVTMFKNVCESKEKDDNGNTKYAYGHGLFTSFGMSLTWDFVGLGFDIRNDSNIKYKNIDIDDKGTYKMKQKSPRFFIQFRF